MYSCCSTQQAHVCIQTKQKKRNEERRISHSQKGSNSSSSVHTNDHKNSVNFFSVTALKWYAKHEAAPRALKLFLKLKNMRKLLTLTRYLKQWVSFVFLINKQTQKKRKKKKQKEEFFLGYFQDGYTFFFTSRSN